MAGIGNSSTTIADIQSTPRTVNELKEFEKILRIRDEIFAGTHPRLKVSEQFIRKAPARQQQQQQPSGSPSAIKNFETQLKRATTNDKPIPGHVLGPSHTGPAAVKSAPVARKPAPGLDPIFLAKSDDLVRAEIQLQRRKIEASLKEQAERSKHEAKEKTAHDVRPEFDVTAVLNKALDIVKPLPSPVEPIAHDVDYADENSLYSSRSPGSPLTWDSEKQVRSDSDGQALSQVASIAGPAGAKTDAQRRHSILQDSTDKPTLPQGPDNLKPPGQTQRSEEMAVDEPEYSPPEPTVPVVELSADDEYQPPEVLDGARHEAVSRLQPSARSRDGQVVRNHITSPVAPQPSRVSPLAIANAPSVQRLLSSKSKRQAYVNGDISDAYSRQTSPEGPVAQQLLPRKRRRVYQPEIQNGRFEPRHNDTADARIKLEPVSPPPFHDTPPARVYRASEHPVYIDISSPQYVASADRREYVTREPFHDLDAPFENGSRRLGTPSEPSIRAVSRLSTRKPARENQDLRRVVSLHNVRLPDAASQEHLGPVPRPHSAARASPFSLVERPSLDKATYYEEVVPTYSRRYQPYDDYPPPSGYREFYVDESGAPRYVEPVAPPRRIVVDEYGNEYYEMVPAPRVRAAPLPTRVVRSDNYPERTYLRSSSVRAPSVMEEGYRARHYLPQEMAPPSVAYRRVADQVREVSDTPRIYPARTVVDRQGVFRSGSVAIEYPAGTPLRRAAYIEEEIPRNRYVRTTSVRPPSQRYESHPQQPQQHRDGLPRVQSVRPGTREVSVYLDENGQPVAREYDERAGYDAAAAATTATSVRSERPSKYVIREDGTREARELVQGGTHRY